MAFLERAIQHDGLAPFHEPWIPPVNQASGR